MIKTAIRLHNGAVFVFDEYGEQLPGYQGRYECVKAGILRDAREDAVFQRVLSDGRLRRVSRDEW